MELLGRPSYITFLVKQVYWYKSQVSGEHFQDHWYEYLYFNIDMPGLIKNDILYAHQQKFSQWKYM